MGLLFTSLAVLFAACIIGVAIVRFAPGGERWGGLGVPWSLFASTAVLAASTLAIERSVGWLKRGQQRRFRRWLRAAWWLGIGFVVVQGWTWWRLDPMRGGLPGEDVPSAAGAQGTGAAPAVIATLLPAAWILVVLTALHALHVASGLVALGVSVRHAEAGRYTASSWPGLRFARAYWHFLAIVWVALLATLAVVLR